MIFTRVLCRLVNFDEIIFYSTVSYSFSSLEVLGFLWWLFVCLFGGGRLFGLVFVVVVVVGFGFLFGLGWFFCDLFCCVVLWGFFGFVFCFCGDFCFLVHWVFLFSFALSTVIVCLRLTEISSTFQRNETKSKGLYHLSQTANRIMKSFQTVNGDCWHMICNKEICCFNLWLIGNAAANPRKERENL